jgi:hypothetical protein
LKYNNNFNLLANSGGADSIIKLYTFGAFCSGIDPYDKAGRENGRVNKKNIQWLKKKDTRTDARGIGSSSAAFRRSNGSKYRVFS